LWLKKFKNYGIYINGQLNQGVYSKDIALYIIQNIGSAGAVNHVIEYLGDTVHQMSIEARMTLCNMAVEAGARTGIIAVDDVTIEYLRTLPFSPIDEQLNQAIDYWRTLYSDDNAKFDRIFTIDATQVVPMVTWGTSPDMACSVNSIIPYPEDYVDPVKQKSVVRALQYMGLESGSKLSDLQFDKVFIGSCTNSRIEDLRIVANIVKDKKIASTLKQALIVPGSGKVKAQAELEGLDKIFLAAGFEWRSPGCSMCLGMNDDHLNPKERCASTSNRNFEGRQGAGGRTHLMSPATAAATAIHGVLTDPRRYIYETIYD
jgi:3-isopropylmalate/(R)-2-methylmalate dehydratase large subunit